MIEEYLSIGFLIFLALLIWRGPEILHGLANRVDWACKKIDFEHAHEYDENEDINRPK